jgi:hypothetical protein
MMQNRVLAVYFSMIRRSAICAVEVIASASSRMMSLYWAMEDVAEDPFEAADGPMLNICFVEAKVLICSRTTSMPLSSEAFSSSTIWRMFFVPYILLASARIVDVLPVPGGP